MSTRPNDPELVLGAGLITDDMERKSELLRRAAEKGNTPAAWAAYSTDLMMHIPMFANDAYAGGDPANPTSMTEARKLLMQQKGNGAADYLEAEDIAPLLEALKRWEAVDPQNALPVALEAYPLTAALRYDQALSRLEAAARLPKVDLQLHGQEAAAARLLTRMGMPEPEAIHTAMISQIMPCLARLRQVRAVACFEAQVARLKGHDAEAVRWLRAVQDFGRIMTESGDDTMVALVGIALEDIGGGFAWKWYPASAVSGGSGPLMGGAIFYGKYHDWYAKQVGAAEDTKLRERVVLSKLRTSALREYSSQQPMMLFGPTAEWAKPLGYSIAALVCLFLFFIVYWSGRPWRDKEEGATRLPQTVTFLLALVAVAPLAAGMVYAHGVRDARAWQGIIDGAVLSIIAAIALPAAAAQYTQVVGYRYGHAWVANHRRVLPIVIALTAIVYLGMSLDTAHARHQWAQEWRAGKHDEFALVKKSLGAKWDHPQVPAGAWYAKYPVLVNNRYGGGP